METTTACRGTPPPPRCFVAGMSSWLHMRSTRLGRYKDGDDNGMPRYAAAARRFVAGMSSWLHGRSTGRRRYKDGDDDEGMPSRRTTSRSHCRDAQGDCGGAHGG